MGSRSRSGESEIGARGRYSRGDEPLAIHRGPVRGRGERGGFGYDRESRGEEPLAIHPGPVQGRGTGGVSGPIVNPGVTSPWLFAVAPVGARFVPVPTGEVINGDRTTPILIIAIQRRRARSSGHIRPPRVRGTRFSRSSTFLSRSFKRLKRAGKSAFWSSPAFRSSSACIRRSLTPWSSSTPARPACSLAAALLRCS